MLLCTQQPMKKEVWTFYAYFAILQEDAAVEGKSTQLSSIKLANPCKQ